MSISRELIETFNYARVWGRSALYAQQRCGLEHRLCDEDVVEIVAKTARQQTQDKDYSARVTAYNKDKAQKRAAHTKQQRANRR